MFYDVLFTINFLSDVPFFANGLEKYHMQCRMIDVVQARKSLGLFLVDAYLFKNDLLPSPLTCLDVSQPCSLLCYLKTLFEIIN